MKRFIAMLLMLCSALLMTAAFAEEAAPEAKITVVEQRFINMEDDGRGFFFAKVQNTFTNTTDEILYDYEMVAALYDQNGELLFINTEVVSGIGVHPGSTITVRLYIYEDIVMYFCREGLTPTTVDALVYCEK